MVVENPQIGLSKDIVAGPTPNGDGTHTLTYQLVTTNTGDIVLNNVQVDDDLSITYAGALSWVVDAHRVVAGPCDPAAAYTGSAPSVDVLDGDDSIAVGESCVIEIDVTVPAGTAVDDISQDGVDNDPTADDDPGNDSDPTRVLFVEEPQIRLSKDIIVEPVNNGDGSYTLTYGLELMNSGNVDLADVQVDDNMSATFDGTDGFAIDNVAVTAGACTASTTYDGAADLGLLAGADTVAVLDSCTIEIAVTVFPGADLGIHNNSATVTGTSPDGASVTDVSQDGDSADPDGDNDPANNSDPTPTSFEENPEIGLSKELVAGPDGLGSGVYTASYELITVNTGDVPLANVQVDDSLETTFGTTTASWSLVGTSVTAGACTSSTSYDGNADTALLAGTDSLAVGESCTIQIDVKIFTLPEGGTFENTATTSGTSLAGTEVTDVSQDGGDVDPDGTGPANNNVPTVFSAEGAPVTAGPPPSPVAPYPGPFTAPATPPAAPEPKPITVPVLAVTGSEALDLALLGSGLTLF